MQPKDEVTTGEFLKHFGLYHDRARQTPVTITRHGRPSVVVLSADRYAQLIAHTQRTQRAYAVGEEPEEVRREMLEAIDSYLADGEKE